MGKSRRNRSGGARRDPIAKTAKPPSDPELAALREAKILPVIKDLKSSDPKSRSAAASAVSSIIQDTKCRKLLLREQIVHTIMTQTITDASVESRAAGWGILQVLAEVEENDFCVHLFRSDIVTAIEFAAKQICEKMESKATPFSKTATAEKSTLASIAASLISLSTALAEAGDDILVAIATNPFIINLISMNVSYRAEGDAEDPFSKLRTDALACFMILCEDNDKLAESISKASESPFVTTIMALKDEVSSDGILSCAVLHNIFASLASSRKANEESDGDDAILVPTLTKAIAAYDPSSATSNGSGWSDPIEYQQLALETLAAIGTTITAVMSGGPAPNKPRRDGPAKPAVDEEDDEDMGEADELADDGEEEEDEDADEDAGEMDQAEMEADMDFVTGADVDESVDDQPLLQALLDVALPELIRIASSQPTNSESMAIQGHALSALNNIAWSLSLFDYSKEHNAGIQKAWSPVAHRIWKTVVSPILASDTADLDLATQVTSLAWAVARVLHSKTPLKPNEQQKFITLYQATKGAPASDGDPFQSLGVKCIGVLGELALSPCPEDLNREIGTFLMTVIASLPQTPAADSVEAYSHVFVIYGDEEFAYDKPVFWANKFANHLEVSVAKARTMAKSVDKKSQPELRLRADEVVMNLTRFLAYKKKHMPAQ